MDEEPKPLAFGCAVLFVLAIFVAALLGAIQLAR
jgi:hypothetical protein